MKLHFVYGTLMSPEVLKELLGRVPVLVPGSLAGYRRWRVPGEGAFGGREAGEGEVEGRTFGVGKSEGLGSCAFCEKHQGQDDAFSLPIIYSPLFFPSSLPPSLPSSPFYSHMTVYPGILPDPSREVDGFLVKELLDSEVVRPNEREEGADRKIGNDSACL
jgi:hypothetical protein